MNANQLTVDEGLLALSSLSRAVRGKAALADLGALTWMPLRQLLPCDTMALFLPDETHDHVVIRFAAGAHAAALQGVARPASTGVAGWVAIARMPALNADPALDLGFRAAEAPALRSSLVVPLVESDALIAVLALYSSRPAAFTGDHVRLLELIGPRLADTLIDVVIADEDSLAAESSPALRLVKSPARRN